MTKRAGWLWLALAAVAAWPSFGQQMSVVDSPHNLSATGAGTVRAATEEQVCIFCHAPHNATPVRPLWNRSMPTDAYAIYTSRSLDARPGQPTGASKMCLSCHDGTIALGDVSSRGMPILMAGGAQTMPHGAANLGTDLRDDHPVSFRYDSSLVSADPSLRDPATLPHELRLDANGELQCTTCHEPHNNIHGDFLAMSAEDSRLCVACHNVGQTTVSGHRSCDACHTPHTAPSGPYLLRERTIGDTCLSCHDGSVPGATDVRSQLRHVSTHETFSRVDPPEPLESHASCADCHDPHTMVPGSAPAPLVHGSFGEVEGMSSSGAPVMVAKHEYEVCYRCHADGNAFQPYVSRVISQNNVREEFSVRAISSHPVEAAGNNPNVPSLLPGWSPASLVRCSDCHASPDGGQVGPEVRGTGTHGSPHRPLLVENYTVTDFTSESARAYALCYRCHDRNSILRDESFSGHRLHVVEQRTPCAACHDAHGISSGQGSADGNTHLINFATRIVQPDPGTGRLEFRDRGVFSGECFLRCHGRTHSGLGYPPGE